MMRNLSGIHQHLEKMISGDCFASDADVYQFWSRWIAFIIRRRMEYAQVINGDFMAPKRLAYRIAELKSWLTLTFPRLRVLIFGKAIACRKVPEFAKQAAAFPDYFCPQELFAKNRREGLKRSVFF